MRRAHFFAAAISTLALVGAATASHAESVSMAGPGQPSHKLFQWDQKGRWSLRLESEPALGRDVQPRDMQAGAYNHVAPSPRVGGAVSFSDAPAQPDRTDLPQTQAPRVKLETSFKF